MDDLQHSAAAHGRASASPVVEASQLPDSLPSNRGACEACRVRKIRCDRETPCLPCQRANIDCVQSTGKRREKRTRILLTPQYERKIDLIDHRLESITGLMQELKTTITNPLRSDNHLTRASDPESARHSTAPTSVTSSSPKAPAPSDPVSATPAVAEGASSLSAHSVFVNDFLRDMFEADGSPGPDAETKETLDSLHHIVNTPNQQSRTRDPSLPNRATHGYGRQRRTHNLPPIQKAVFLIREAKAQRLAGMGWVYEYLSMQSFGDLCLEVYFSEDPSLYDSISVNAGLFSLFGDYAATANLSPEEKEEFAQGARLCRENLGSRLSEIPLNVPATTNAIASLLFGAFYAIEFSTPALCWSLSSKASELCQTLGYHRAKPHTEQKLQDPAYTSFLFWMTYYVDKSLSLRLGRASTIPDWDITVRMPTRSDSDQDPILAFLVIWVQTARCQGNIYEILYPPGSAAQPDSVRKSRVDFLVSNLLEIDQEMEKTKDDWMNIAKANSGDDLHDFFSISDHILRLSLLTHVYRAAPRHPASSAAFSPECIDVARAVLNRHFDCMKVIAKTNDIYLSQYIHWTLLFAPFIPFIVVFCHVMESQDQADLATQDAFVQSIHAASSVSESAAKMHRLFQVLLNIASRYTASVDSQRKGKEASSTMTVDTQLAALGLPYPGWPIGAGGPSQVQTDTNTAAAVITTSADDGQVAEAGMQGARPKQNTINELLWTGSEMQLEDWFYSNSASMELLQDTPPEPSFKE